MKMSGLNRSNMNLFNDSYDASHALKNPEMQTAVLMLNCCPLFVTSAAFRS